MTKVVPYCHIQEDGLDCSLVGIQDLCATTLVGVSPKQQTTELGFLRVQSGVALRMF